MPDDQSVLANLPVIYTNNIRLAIAFTDFRLFLGEALPQGPTRPVGDATPVEEPPLQVDRICVVISPEILPQLIAGLQAGVKQYESTFGSLRKPPQPLQSLPQASTTATPTPNPK